jgi:bacterioferritin-associated ferredoxin
VFLCSCLGISERTVKQVGEDGAVTPEALIVVLGLDDDRCCGRCVDSIEEFVQVAIEGARQERPRRVRRVGPLSSLVEVP